MLQELREKIVSNSESLKKLPEDASLLYLYSRVQYVEQMVLEGSGVCDYSSKVRL